MPQGKFEVQTYPKLKLEDIMKSHFTQHLSSTRLERLNFAKKLMFEDDEIISTFLIDKGHKDGKELHNLTKSGLIFILNEKKYLQDEDAFITVLIARPGQVRRMYEAVYQKPPSQVLNICYYHVNQGYNTY